VPSILQAMFEGLKERLPGGIVMTRLTVQCEIGEGTIATIMESVQRDFAGVSVGSYPWFKPGNFGTAVVVSGLDADITQNAATTLANAVKATGANAFIVTQGDTA